MTSVPDHEERQTMTSDTSTISGLLERVKAASGPDRVLDAGVWLETVAPTDLINGHSLASAIATYPQDASIAACWAIPPITASIDAVLALVERCGLKQMIALSGPWHWADHTDRAGEPIWRAQLDDTLEDITAADLEHHAPTAPLAILTALLSALQSQEEER